MITGAKSQHDLQFGLLDLIDIDTTQGAGGFRYEVLATDADWGNPVPVEEKVISWLQDGAIVALRGYDNRDLFLKIRIIGNDGQGLALGEQALMFETGKPNTLTWTPPDGIAKPCVFGVITSHIEHTFDDLGELRLERTYGLRITAEPFVRSATPVSVSQAAPPGGGPTVVSIDACTATTNWTGTPNGPTTSGGAVKESKVVNAFDFIGTLSLKRSSLAVNMTGTPYLRIDWDTGNFTPDTITVKVNGTTVLTPVAQSGNAKWYDYGGVVGVGTTLSSIEITVTQNTTRTSVNVTRVLEVSDISRTDSLVDPGSTNRQLARTLAVAGSARTQGNLAVEDAANALGTCLVYTCPAVDGLRQPNLRTLLQPGPTPTVDATTVSGATSPLDTQHIFSVPIAGLTPGSYLILARVKHASTGSGRTISWITVSSQGGLESGDRQTGQVAFSTTAGAWKIVTVGATVLPPTKVGSSGAVLISLTASTGVVLDEAWIFNVDTGRLTWVECGTAAPSAGGSSNRLWLDAPTVDNPVPAVYRGFTADRSDSQHAASEMVSFGNHEFVPKAMNVFTVTTNSTASTVTLSHYPRWHTHAAA